MRESGSGGVRDELAEFLGDEGVETALGHPEACKARLGVVLDIEMLKRYARISLEVLEKGTEGGGLESKFVIVVVVVFCRHKPIILMRNWLVVAMEELDGKVQAGKNRRCCCCLCLRLHACVCVHVHISLRRRLGRDGHRHYGRVGCV